MRTISDFLFATTASPTRIRVSSANCLLSVADHCLRSRNYINLITAGKQPEWQWLDIDSAVRHCTAGAGIWQWASNDLGDPDVVMACAGDVPTLETLAAVTLLRAYVPHIRVRVINVVDLMVLQPQSEHPTAWRIRISTNYLRQTNP
jgi:xylulose-5-phosphate/fructose-6-phosphate phosphoketolase